MPLAFAAGAGGIITLIGTPPNLLVSQNLEKAGFAPFGFFEFAWIGVPMLIVTMVYMLFLGKYLLPKSEITEITIDAEAAAEATASTTDPKKMWITGAVLVVVVIGMMLEPNFKAWGLPLNLSMIAIIGALFLVITKCLTEKQAYFGIDWVTIFLFAGMLPIAGAMQSSGAGKLIANRPAASFPNPISPIP